MIKGTCPLIAPQRRASLFSLLYRLGDDDDDGTASGSHGSSNDANDNNIIIILVGFVGDKGNTFRRASCSDSK